jgi:Flp pilus assembly protein TadD
MKPLASLPTPHQAAPRSPARRPWRSALVLLLVLVLGTLLLGCTSLPRADEAAATAALLRDRHFSPPAEPVNPGTALALSPAMRAFADAELAKRPHVGDRRRALIDALYGGRGEAQSSPLGLRYDAERTRTAAQAFEARAGNCLSLVLMTAAFAQHLGLPVQFQNVIVDETYSRSGDLYLASGHVNLMLGRGPAGPRVSEESQWLTVDFLPQSELRHQRIQRVDEATVIAMFMNNRAAEALAAGLVDESYAWARAALRQDPHYLAGINTLAVIYLRRGLLAEAEQALQHVLARDSSNSSALSNLIIVLNRSGRGDEANAAATRLAQLQPYPPYHFHDLGRAALARGDYALARDLFRRELRRQPYQHESHHGLASAYHGLGDFERAARHLGLAQENGGTLGLQQLYAAKLAWLRAHGATPAALRHIPAGGGG